MQVPQLLIDSLQPTIGFDEADFLETHNNENTLTSIRINTQKLTDASVIDVDIDSAVPWCNGAFYLKERPKFTLDPLLHAGGYYVQEASSMFLATAFHQLIEKDKPLKVLDLCAAPGGKSTLLASLLSSNDILISNEVIANRNTILQENITKWGNINSVVIQNDASNIAKLTGFFDLIVIDAPCSGSGLFRKDANAANEWSVNNVALCSQRQQRIIADILPSLKEDGFIFYSTCSYSESENETIVDWMHKVLSLEAAVIDVEHSWGITTSVTQLGQHSYRFWPYLTKGEGFFFAALQKKQLQTAIKPNSKLPETVQKAEKEIINANISTQQDLFYLPFNEQVLATTPEVANIITLLQKQLYIKKLGVNLGIVSKKELIPDHELALCYSISNHYQKIEVDRVNALLFLRKDNFIINDNHAKGWAVITHKNIPLGFIKNLGNRINNYYPKNWRILIQIGE